MGSGARAGSALGRPRPPACSWPMPSMRSRTRPRTARPEERRRSPSRVSPSSCEAARSASAMQRRDRPGAARVRSADRATRAAALRGRGRRHGWRRGLDGRRRARVDVDRGSRRRAAGVEQRRGRRGKRQHRRRSAARQKALRRDRAPDERGHASPTADAGRSRSSRQASHPDRAPFGRPAPHPALRMAARDGPRPRVADGVARLEVVVRVRARSLLRACRPSAGTRARRRWAAPRGRRDRRRERPSSSARGGA